MPNPHDKSPILVTESGQLLLPMHERFFCVLKYASQVCILPDADIFTFDIAPPLDHVPTEQRCEQEPADGAAHVRGVGHPATVHYESARMEIVRVEIVCDA